MRTSAKGDLIDIIINNTKMHLYTCDNILPFIQRDQHKSYFTLRTKLPNWNPISD